MKKKKKPNQNIQLRLPIRLSDTEFKNDYSNVNIRIIQIVSKRILKEITEKYNLNVIDAELMIFIGTMKISKLNRIANYFNISSVHYYYARAKQLIELGYIHNDISKSVGRFPAYNYTLTSKGEQFLNEYDSLSIQTLKNILFQ